MSIRISVLLVAVLAARGQPLRLPDLERMALEKNPAIAQAAARVRAAAGRVRQAGLYPNPMVGATGDEIAGGPIIRGGELGGFFEQRIVTAGKLGLSRRVAEQEQREMEASAAAERQRVLNLVRELFYQALGDQMMIEVRTRLARLAAEAVRTSRELANVGQADKPDVLSAEIEAQRLELGLTTARNSQERTWRQLGAVVHDPSLKVTRLEGNIEEVPRLDFDQALAKIYKESPDLRAAELGASRAEFALRRAQVEKLPDIVMRGGVRYNRELLEEGPAGFRRPVGREGFFDIGIELPLFNRNQGVVSAARAELERARLDSTRTRLALRARLAGLYREYRDSLAMVDRYKDQMLPKAQEAYQMYLNSFRQMAAAYPQALIAQRNLFQLQEEYVSALVMTWQRSVEIEGLLLSAGEDPPSMAGWPQ
jgi:cobalt-zinc-cadmium efflux system outer membrane protein